MSTAVGSAPMAASASIAAEWPRFAAYMRAVTPSCEARGDAAQGSSGRHAYYREASTLGATSVGSGGVLS